MIFFARTPSQPSQKADQSRKSQRLSSREASVRFKALIQVGNQAGTRKVRIISNDYPLRKTSLLPAKLHTDIPWQPQPQSQPQPLPPATSEEYKSRSPTKSSLLLEQCIKRKKQWCSLISRSKARGAARRRYLNLTVSSSRKARPQKRLQRRK